MSESDIDTAFAMASPGTTLAFGAGSFSFTNTLQITSSGVSVIGAGIDVTVLDFTGETGGSDGIDAQYSNNLLLQGFTVKNAPHNGIKVLGSDYVIFEALKVYWTTPGTTTSGPYGIYPIQVNDLLIENCVVNGANDSGIYVGQTVDGIVRNNEVYGNVAGIEIENTNYADVYGNYAHDNTAGIMVFDLPDLPAQGIPGQGTHNTRVFNNRMINNNTANFAQPGDIVGIIPSGSGFVQVANSEVEVFNNTVTGNDTTALAVVSYALSQLPINNPSYYEFPTLANIHDNFVSGNGLNPDATRTVGLLLSSAQSQLEDMRAPDLVYDGVVDPFHVSHDGGFLADGGIKPSLDAMNICFHNNGGDAGAAIFGNMNAYFLDVYAQLPDGGPNPGYDGGSISNLPQIIDQTLGAFDCTPAALPQVVFDGGWFPDGGP